MWSFLEEQLYPSTSLQTLITNLHAEMRRRRIFLFSLAPAIEAIMIA